MYVEKDVSIVEGTIPESGIGTKWATLCTKYQSGILIVADQVVIQSKEAQRKDANGEFAESKNKLKEICQQVWTIKDIVI